MEYLLFSDKVTARLHFFKSTKADELNHLGLHSSYGSVSWVGRQRGQARQGGLRHVSSRFAGVRTAPTSPDEHETQYQLERPGVPTYYLMMRRLTPYCGTILGPKAAWKGMEISESLGNRHLCQADHHTLPSTLKMTRPIHFVRECAKPCATAKSIIVLRLSYDYVVCCHMKDQIRFGTQ